MSRRQEDKETDGPFVRPHVSVQEGFGEEQDVLGQTEALQDFRLLSAARHSHTCRLLLLGRLHWCQAMRLDRLHRLQLSCQPLQIRIQSGQDSGFLNRIYLFIILINAEWDSIIYILYIFFLFLQ